MKFGYVAPDKGFAWVAERIEFRLVCPEDRAVGCQVKTDGQSPDEIAQRRIAAPDSLGLAPDIAVLHSVSPASHDSSKRNNMASNKSPLNDRAQGGPS